jgi:hypothetical protein
MFNAVLAFIPKPVFAGLVVALAASTLIQSCRVDDLKDENAKYEAAVEQCAKTNAQNKTVVDFLKLQNDQCLEGRREDETKLANAAAAWDAERQLLEEKAENVEVRNVEVYRDPSCAELAQMDITNVCPAFVERLRQRAESYNRVRNDNSRSTGTN